ncbi:MAG TPA: FG-GAP repeat protein [Polyangiaceae bacterium]|nr:FG-GAP repeat protein [Polyangiaceae bacterium]
MANGTGAVYVFERGASGWAQKQKLVASDAIAGSAFGQSVALEGDLLVAGAPQDSSSNGAAYLFRRSNNSWQQEAKLVPSDPGYGKYGGALRIQDGRVLVSAPWRKIGSLSNAGAVYVFERVGNAWTETQKLTSPGAQELGGFGNSLATDGNTLLVGAYGEQEAAGVAYRYRHTGNAYVFEATLEPAVSILNDRFGGSVAVEGDLNAVGAYGEPSQGLSTGTVYLYNSAPLTRGQCVQADGSQTGDPAVSVIFTSVDEAGTTEAIASTTGPAVPVGYKLGQPPTFYEISTTAEYTGPVQVCIDYSQVSYADENTLQLLHYENGTWLNLCASGSGCALDTTANRICAYSSTLSPFVVVESALFAKVQVPGGNRTTEAVFLAQNFSAVGDTVQLDVYLKSPQPNPANYGTLQLFLTLDGSGIVNQSLGTKSLTGLSLNAWTTLSFTVPAATRTRLLTGIDTGHFIVKTSTPTNAPALTLNRLRFAGTLTARAESAPRRSDIAGLLSFEGPYDWSAQGGTLALDASPVTDGARSLRFHRTSTNSVAKSAAFFASELGTIGTRMTFDVYVPPGVSWGDVQGVVSCPVNTNQYVGSATLVGRPANQFAHISLTLPNAVRQSLLVANQACTLSVAINAPVTAQDFRLDRLRIE